MSFHKYSKIWLNGQPGLYMNFVGSLCKVLVFVDGTWMEKFVEFTQLSTRHTNISETIFKQRKNSLDYRRID